MEKLSRKLKRLVPLLSCLVILIVLIGNSTLLFADQGNINLNVTGTVVDATLSPGQIYVHTFNVSSETGMNVQMEVAGLGQGVDGSTTNLSAAQDTRPNSARTFVTLEKTSLQLAAHVSQDVKATITVPAGKAPGEYYADIFVHSVPAPGSTIMIAGDVVIIIKVPGYTPVRTGGITNVDIANKYTGKALTFNTTFNNSGNCRITGAKNIVTVKDSIGNVKWSNSADVPSPSLIPGYPRLIESKYSTGLSAGNYTVKSDVTLADGTQLDTKTVSFTVTDPPPMPSAPGLVSPGNATPPGPTIDTLAPIIQWSQVSGADYYNLNVTRSPYTSSDSVFSSERVTGTVVNMPTGILFAGQKYAWQVSAVNVTGSSNSSTFYFQTAGTSTPPVVASAAATNVTSNGATLNANLSSLGTATTVVVRFEYGTTSSYGSTTDTQNVSSTGAFHADLSDLTPDTTYYYRAKATGSTAVFGSEMTFKTTLPTSPVITTGTASNISATSATLNGELTSMGNSSNISIQFEFGTSPTYDNITPAQYVYAAGSVGAAIAGLTPNTTYHYRAKATGSTAVNGNDAIFTTSQANLTQTPSVTPPTTTASTTPIASSRTPTQTMSALPTNTPISSLPADVQQKYLLPQMEPASLVVASFKSNEVPKVDAVQQSGITVALEGTAGKSGSIIVGNYSTEPVDEVVFSDGLIAGGTGKQAIKYVDVRAEGFSQGTAHITLNFSDDDITEFDPNTLFIAYYSGNKWHRCDNISISQNDHTISGDIPVSRLNGTVVGLGGDSTSANSIPYISQNINTTHSNSVSWSLVTLIAAPVLIIGLIAFVIERNRRKTAVKN